MWDLSFIKQGLGLVQMAFTDAMLRCAIDQFGITLIAGERLAPSQDFDVGRIALALAVEVVRIADHFASGGRLDIASHGTVIPAHECVPRDHHQTDRQVERLADQHVQRRGRQSVALFPQRLAAKVEQRQY